MSYVVPETLARNCHRTLAGTRWLAALPGAVERALALWSLRMDPAEPHPTGTASLVLFVKRSDDSPAVLKLGLPHMEAEHEAVGLRFWDGDPTVRLLEADDSLNALLLERCVPGTALSSLVETEQDVVITTILSRLWRDPDQGREFRPLEFLLLRWSREAQEGPAPIDRGLLNQGMEVFSELPKTVQRPVVLATDLHAGNVLRSTRRPWLAIDPKPFVGDPAYDLVQHLLNSGTRMQSDPWGTIRRVADLAQQDERRVGLWVFARIATGTWRVEGGWSGVARELAP